MEFSFSFLECTDVRSHVPNAGMLDSYFIQVLHLESFKLWTRGS
jgi:hypothetical protein